MKYLRGAIIGLLLGISTISCNEKNIIPKIPNVRTIEVFNVTETTAFCEGVIDNEGSSRVYEFGVCWSTDSVPTIMDQKTSGIREGEDFPTINFYTILSNLSLGTTYYACAYATNKEGTGYGMIRHFTTFDTIPHPDVTDIDGNIYTVVRIGYQYWLRENLRTTKYNYGYSIPLVTDETTWSSSRNRGYCWYNNDITNKNIYGALYNWYSINNYLCPVGWRVPQSTDLDYLKAYLDLKDIGGKLKENGTSHWSAPNTGATNETGFSALPGGYRGADPANFNFINTRCYLWTSSVLYGIDLYPSNYAYCFIMSYDSDDLLYHYTTDLQTHIGYDKRYGLSVRCIKELGFRFKPRP